MAQAYFLNLRLFLEGIEVPVIAGSVASAPGSPSVASIQIIPADTVLFLKPRTVVHLFFYDYLDRKSQGDDRYKQLFAGELVSINFNKDPNTRFVVLQCLDHTNIWDSTYHYYQNFGGDNTNLDGIYAQVGGQTTSLFSDQPGATNPLTLIRKHIEEGAKRAEFPLSLPGTGGILGGVIHLIDKLGGVVAGGKLQGQAINPFYVGYNLRNRLTDQIFASSRDSTSVNLFDLSAWSELIDRDFGQGGFRLSFRQIIDTVLKYVYYSWAHITTPKYVPDGRKGVVRKAEVTQKSVRINFDKQIGLIKAGIEKIKKGRSAGINTNKADLIRSFQTTDEAQRKGKSRVRVNLASSIEENKLRLIARSTTGSTLFDGTGTIEEEAERAFGTALFNQEDPLFDGLGDDGRIIGMSQLIGSGQVYVQDFKDRITELEKSRDQISSQSSRNQTRRVRRSDRLNSIIFRPDLYFLPPPKCNVLFPELYTTFGFSRNMLEEASRIFVDTGHYLSRIDSPLLRAIKVRVLGPDLPIISGPDANRRLLTITARDVKKRKKFLSEQAQEDNPDATKSLNSRPAPEQSLVILPHEVFTGILPHWATIPDIAVYFARSGKRPSLLKHDNQDLKAISDSVGREVDAKDTLGRAALLVPYLQDAANFEFFKLRFAPRTANLQGRFNPYLAVGFPSLVIDKPLTSKRPSVILEEDRDAAKEKPSAKTLPGTKSNLRPTKDKLIFSDPTIATERFKFGTHFIGMIASLRHAINQEGGFTFVDLSHVRTHNEAVDFQGDLKSVGLEDIIFPTWFSDIFRPKQISKFYEDAFGIPSIVDSVDRNVDLPIAAGERARTIRESTGVEADIEKLELELESNQGKLADRANDYNFVGAFSFYVFFKIRVGDALTYGPVHVTDPTIDEPGLRIPTPAPSPEKPKELKRYLVAISRQLNLNAARYEELVTVKQDLEDSRDRVQQQLKIADEMIRIEEDIEFLEKEIRERKADLKKSRKGKKDTGPKSRTIRSGNDVRKSVEALVLQYSEMVAADSEKEEHSRVDEFVNSYIFREIATLPQILGVPANEFFAGKRSEISNSFLAALAPLAGIPGIPGIAGLAVAATSQALTQAFLDRFGNERIGGFHSEAFGSLPIPEADQLIERIDTKRTKIKSSGQLDPRGPRRSIVRGYLQEIRRGALRG